MLSRLFLQILNMSFTASFVILFVLAARLLLKKAPKLFSYALWSVVLFRLICPFSFESVLSILPAKVNPISQDIVYAAVPRVDTGIAAINHAVNASLPAATPYASINPLQGWVFLGTALWLAGIAVLLSYSVASLLTLQKRLKGAVCESGHIYIAKRLDTPFVIGILRPRVYLPASLSAEEKNYILLHEQIHIRHWDHLLKPLFFCVLCLHWFNPLVWAAFFAGTRDMEMACDEAVIRKLGNGLKKDYSASLLALATGRRIVGGTPLAFGEGDTRARIKNVLNYKRPAFWTAALALGVLVCIGVGLIANPVATRASMQWAKNLEAKDIQKIELVVMPGKEGEQYKIFEQLEFEEAASLVNQSRGRYIEAPAPIDGGSMCLYITDKEGVRHWVCNSGNTYLIIDGDFYKSGYDWLSSWKYTKGNAFLPDDFDFGNEPPDLTLATLKELNQKRNSLSWEDFSPYKSQEVGSGLYIRRYSIDDRFYLLIGGPNTESTPWYIRLCAAGSDRYVELGKDEGKLDRFIESTGIYRWQESKEPVKPAVILKENNQFQFTYSVLSSYFALGTYEINDHKLILKTEDGKYTYTFEMKEDTLIFKQEESSAIPSYANLPDGAVFRP